MLVRHQVWEHIALLWLLGSHSAAILERRLEIGWERAAVDPLVCFNVERGFAFELGLGIKSFQQLSGLLL